MHTSILRIDRVLPDAFLRFNKRTKEAALDDDRQMLSERRMREATSYTSSGIRRSRPHNFFHLTRSRRWQRRTSAIRSSQPMLPGDFLREAYERGGGGGMEN